MIAPLLLLWWTFRQVPFRQVWMTMKQLDWLQICVWLVSNLGIVILMTGRWWLILRALGQFFRNRKQKGKWPVIAPRKQPCNASKKISLFLRVTAHAGVLTHDSQKMVGFRGMGVMTSEAFHSPLGIQS